MAFALATTHDDTDRSHATAAGPARLLILAALAIAWPGAAIAQVVSNPGPITISLPTAEITYNNTINPPATVHTGFDFDTLMPEACNDGVNNDDHTDTNNGVQDTFVDSPADPDCSGATDDSEDKSGFQPEQTMTFTGTIDANGNINIPAGNITIPPIYAWSNQTGLGGDRVNINTFFPTHDATGTLNPITGVMTLRVRYRMRFFVDGTGAFDGPGNNCYMGSTSNPHDFTLTTGVVTSTALPNLAGVAYDSGDGSMTMVSYNNATVPGAGGGSGTQCGAFDLGAGPINNAFGTPASPGNVSYIVAGSVSPIILPPPPPDLTVAKSHSGDFTVGTQGSYSIVVSNVGTGDTTDTIAVTDTLPALMTYASGSGTGWNCNAVSQDVTCTHAGPLAASNSLPTLTINVDPISAGATTNTAVVSTSGDTNAANDSDGDPTTVNPAPPPDLTIVKSHTGDFTVGTQDTYSLDVSNVGVGDTAGLITVTDSLPTELSFVSGTGTGWSCGAVSQNVTCTHNGPLAPSNSLPTITLTVDPISDGSIINAATVSTANDSNAGNDTDNDPTTIDPLPAHDLTIDKSHVGSFTTGSQGVYSLDVDNVGTSATTGLITVTDSLPTELAYVSGTGTGWSCGAVSQDVTCTHNGPVGAASALPTITLTVDALSAGSIVNTAIVSTPGDSNGSNDSDDDPTNINAAPQPDLSVDKSHTGDFVAGSQGTYSIVVTNDGNLATSGTITVTDTLPAALTYFSATGSGWGCGAVLQVVTCTHAGPLSPTASLPAITLTVDVDASGAPGVTNTATVSTPGDTNSFNDSDDDPTNVDACPGDPAKLEPGVCGCGTPDDDSDGDMVEDCIDGCPNDGTKTAPGVCGCNVPDDDSDGDMVEDCIDDCPNDGTKVDPGVCGCNIPDDDGDGDMVEDCIDGCPADGNKSAPGACGCGVPDDDLDMSGVPDCIESLQNTAKQKCITSMNKAGAKVAKTQGKEVVSCLRQAASGQIANAQGCLSADIKLKVARAQGKTIDAASKFCTFGVPDFGYTSAGTVNAAATGQEISLAAEAFGAPLDAAVIDEVSDATGAGCQAGVARGYEKLTQKRLREFLKCKKKGLKSGTIRSAQGLELCFDTVAADAKGKVAKAVAQLGDVVAERCGGVTIATAFPGTCGAAPELHTCLDQAVACRTCRMLNAMDGLSEDCDSFDDGIANASCAP